MLFRLTARAERELAALSRADQKRIADKIRFFARQDDPLTFAKPLAGYDAFRFRVGDYRIILRHPATRSLSS